MQAGLEDDRATLHLPRQINPTTDHNPSVTVSEQAANHLYSSPPPYPCFFITAVGPLEAFPDTATYPYVDEYLQLSTTFPWEDRLEA